MKDIKTVQNTEDNSAWPHWKKEDMYKEKQFSRLCILSLWGSHISIITVMSNIWRWVNLKRLFSSVWENMSYRHFQDNNCKMIKHLPTSSTPPPFSCLLKQSNLQEIPNKQKHLEEILCSAFCGVKKEDESILFHCCVLMRKITPLLFILQFRAHERHTGTQ